MSMVSTITPSAANFCFPAQPQAPTSRSSPSRPRPSRASSPPSASLQVEAGPLLGKESQATLVVPGIDSNTSTGATGRSPSRPAHHSHRRSAAVSHDFNASPLFTATSPKESPAVGSTSPLYHPYSRSPTLTFASSSFSPQPQSYTFSASSSSLPLEESGTAKSPKKKAVKVSFANEPIIGGTTNNSTGNSTTTSSNHGRTLSLSETQSTSASGSHTRTPTTVSSALNKPNSTYDGTTELNRCVSTPGMIKVSTAGSISSNSSIINSKGVSKSRSRRHRHKKVRSWAGHLIRFGSSKKEAKTHGGAPAVDSPLSRMDIDLDDDEDSSAEELLHSSSYIPAVLFDDSMDFTRFSDTIVSPEPKIDLDAALGPFRTPSLSTDLEFGSHQYFHRRSESAPEMTLGPAFRGMKRKMGPVVEEEPDAEHNEEESTTTAFSNVSISPVRPVANVAANLTTAPAIEAPSIIAKPPSPTIPAPRYYTSRGYKSNGGSPTIDQTPKSPEMNSVFSNSTTSINTIDEKPQIDEPPAAATIIRVVNQFSEIDDVPTVDSLDAQDGLDLGEPGPEIRCSFDSSSMRSKQRLASPHPSTASFRGVQTTQSTAGQNRTPMNNNINSNRLSTLLGRRPSQESTSVSFNGSLSSSKRNPASRVWGWIRGKRSTSQQRRE
ncbi:hypothetical protein AWJ20_1870 [Sugiyamaella lignohabitans]|uniref:Uncharacterized protein n=1 Tax=Sugiyamaella lignohabitans TaxID=796027 RepID=A0A167E2V8_9ASCO|nr:uncharacterized protein AWJ20_1870 [Sugiyamaella lignohabitans]ANB13574.1 hypothetical protein AWJ20_1870 [Sugiyamaella lignohabitans]